MTEVLTYEALKTKCDALLMENVARGEIIERLIGIFGASGYHAVQNSIDPCSALMYDAMQALKGSCTSAALAAIEARGAVAAIENLISRKERALAEMHPDTHAYGATQETVRNQIYDLELFAIELREAK